MANPEPEKAAPSWAGEVPSDLSLVQIAERLERVTSWIEAERVREREARAEYRRVADDVESRIASIREFAGALLEEQRKRMSSFSGLIGRGGGADSIVEPKGNDADVSAADEGDDRRTFADAVLAVWSVREYRRPLTTEQIIEALPKIGYTTRATSRSLKSSLNQALARLCREGKVGKYRLDGTPLSERDGETRARRYMAAAVKRQ